MKQRRYKLTIVGPIIISVLLVLVFATIFAISSRANSANIKEGLDDVSLPVLVTTSKLLFNPLYNLDVTKMNSILDPYVDGTTIVYAAVYNMDGEQVVEINKKWAPDIAVSQELATQAINQQEIVRNEVGDYLILTKPISAGTTAIGAVEIIFDTTPLQESLGTAKATISATLIIALIITTFLFFVLFRYAIRPLERLTVVAQEISRGNSDIKIPMEGSDEIHSLAVTLDELVETNRASVSTLEERVAERTQALSSVAEISTAASTILESDKLLQKVVDLSKERFGFYHAHIYLLNETGDTLVLTSGAGEVGRQMVAEGRAIPLSQEQSLVSRAAREKKGVIVNDVTQAPDFLPNPMLPDTRSELAVPMIVGEKVIGVFDAQSDVVGRFTDADISVQTTLATQVASTVQNARQYNESMQFKLGIENSGDAVFATDVKGTIIYANPGFEKVYGYPPAEVIGKNPRIIKSGLLTSENYQAFWGALMSKNSVTGEIVNKHKDGRLVYIAGTNSAIVNDAGEITGFLAVHHDITEQKQNQNLSAQRARQQEAINMITQKIQGATTIEHAMQVAARELGRALGQKQTFVALDPSALDGSNRAIQESVK